MLKPTDDGRYSRGSRDQRREQAVVAALAGLSAVALMGIAMLGQHENWPRCTPDTTSVRVGGVLMGGCP